MMRSHVLQCRPPLEPNGRFARSFAECGSMLDLQGTHDGEGERMASKRQQSGQMGGRTLRRRIHDFIFTVPEPGPEPTTLIPREKVPSWVPEWMREGWFIGVVILTVGIAVGDHPVVRVISWWLLCALTGYLVLFKKNRNAFVVVWFILSAALVLTSLGGTVRGIMGG